MSTIIADRLQSITKLSSGSHKPTDGEMCVMEAVAYVAGERWSYRPKCACPVITNFMVDWNDDLPDADRTRLLAPLIPLLAGTRSTKAVAERRSYMALDWLIRVNTAKWLAMVPSLQDAAESLRDLDEIVDIAGATAAGVKARAAGAAAAWGDARAAAGDALKPTSEWLQASAIDLVKRMCEVTV